MKAPIWRSLMAIGMKFHHYAYPKPPKPNFKIVIPSRLSPRGGKFKLVFYVPDTYLDEADDDDFRYPVVVNFHGGGFTLGTGTDDARWASSVVHTTGAVFVSVEYRLAPEYPFSVGVEDGTDAILYLASHAEELRLDPHRIALSGFSAGGNFAFTVPLMLYDLQHDAGKRTLLEQEFTNLPSRPNSSYHNKISSRNTSTTSLVKPRRPQIYKGNTLHPTSGQFRNGSTLSLPPLRAISSAQSSNSILKLSDLEPTALEIAQRIPDLTIKCIVSFYPPTDFRTARAEKRSTNPHPEKNLPLMLTNLFDDSYMHPKSCIDPTDPYLSPACASDDFLRSAYPDDIVMYTCEYDMLNAEGVAFGERLSGPAVGKRIHGGLIKRVPHAFDKKPNPISFPKAADRCYAEACAELKRCFGGRTSVEEIRVLDQSLQVDRFEAEVQGDVLIGEDREEEREGFMGVLSKKGKNKQDEEEQEERTGEGFERRNTISAFRSKWRINQTPTPTNRKRASSRSDTRERKLSSTAENPDPSQLELATTQSG